MNKKIICYYHNDLDGIFSAAIVKEVYPDAKFVAVQYGENDICDLEQINGKLCIIVDYSFKNMEEVIKHSIDIIWIDHHKSAMEQENEFWKSSIINGIRSLNKAACELTWNYFFPNDETPEAVKLIGDMDMWKFKYGHRTKQFIEGLSILDFEVGKNDTIIDLLINNGYGIDSLCDKGATLLMAKRRRIEKTFNEGMELTFMKHKTYFVNTNHDTSNMGEYIYKNKGYPVAFIWSYRKDKVICSLRSNTVDVGAIAKEFGGGGHKFAAGFEMDWEEFYCLMSEDKT